MSTILFYFLILLLPTQLGRHFWPDFSYLSGLRTDYLSPTIYLTDIIIILLFISVMPNLFRQLLKIRKQVQDDKKKKSLGRTKGYIFLLLTVCYLLFVTFFAVNPMVSFLQLIRILELVFLGLYFSRNIGKNIKMSTVIFLLSLTVFYESLLSVWQFAKQGSVGGVWWWLGERTFNNATPFISQAAINGQLLLRSYGTFSHPNVLGGFLAVALPLILFHVCYCEATKWPRQSYLSGKKIVSSPAKGGFLAMTIMIIVLGLIALFLSFSRTAWIVGGAAFLLVVFKKILPSWYLLIIGLLIIIGTYLLVGNSIVSRFRTLEDVDKKSLIVREQLNLSAVKIIKQSPVFGVGLNNFLVALPRYYQGSGVVRFFQPAHNIYLEIAAETGLIGLLIFVIFITLTMRNLISKHSYLIFLVLGEILVLGLFDHYFYTLRQGQMLFALVLGLAWTKKAVI